MSVSPLWGSPKPQFFDDNGAPLNNGKLYAYTSGTSTPLDTYTSTAGSTTNSNPIVLNSRGEPSAQLHGTDGTAYKLVLQDSEGATIWTEDVVYSANSSTLSVTASYLNATLTKNAAYTVTTADEGKLIECSANTFTITLLPVATAGEGFVITVVNNGDGVVTVDGDTAETINGQTTVTLQPGEHIILTATTTDWNGPHYKKGLPIAVGAGTVDAITADFTPNLTLTNGVIFQVKAVGQITSTTPSLAIDGLTAKTIVKEGNKALSLYNISSSSQTLLLQYDSTLDKFILLNPTELTFTMLSSPELLASSITANSWSTINSTTLANATAKYALIRASALAAGLTLGGDLNYIGSIYLRKTGSGLSNNGSTLIASNNNTISNGDVGETYGLNVSGDGFVELDASYDFDVYILRSGFTSYDNADAYLIGYWS